LARLKSRYPPASAASVSTSALGDWYASQYRIGNRSLVIAVAEHSRLCVVCEPHSPGELVVDLQARLAVLLRDLGIPVAAVNGELRQMAVVEAGPTRSRSVLGSLNDHRYSVEAWFQVETKPFTLAEMAIGLAERPSALLNWSTHGEVAVQLVCAAS
jgi:hypothetical protein